jgi:Tfp pilus assembly PilM family ATPase
MFKKKTDCTLAIDLAADAVRVLDMRLRRGVPRILAFASQAVAAGTAESLPERQLSALASLLATHRLKTQRCIAALPTSLVLTRSIAIDNSKNQPHAEQVRTVLQNRLPFDPKDLLFDFWPVGDPASNSRTQEVLVVATQASVVDRYLSGMEKLKLTCLHLDVAPCALASLIANTATNQGGLVGAIALSESGGYFAIVERKKVLFWRPFELPSSPKNGAAPTPSLDRIGDEISKCVSHMVGSMQVEPMTELFVFGHGSDDPTFAQYLLNRFHMSVRSPSPFESLPAESMPVDVRNAVKAAVATHFAAVVGLAMQPAGGSANG